MNRKGQSDPRRREAPRTSFWAGILLLVLIKIVSSFIGV
jgi:hypothetical protein